MKRATLAVVTGLMLGAAIWLIWPVVTNVHEPWDRRLDIFVSVLALSGIIVTVVGGRRFWMGLVGLYVGQLLVMFLSTRPYANRAPVFVGACVLALFTLVAVVSSAITALILWAVAKHAAARTPSAPDGV